MKIRNVLPLILLGLSLVNCSIDVSIEDITGNDFLKSSILATSRGVGDGQTSASVVVILKNSDNSIVANHTPVFNFIDNNGSAEQGNGITYSVCTPSNEQGISTCSIKSIQVGARRLSFNNILIELIGQVYFDPPKRDGNFFQVLSSAQIDEAAGGYTVTSQTGSFFKGLIRDVNSYTLFTNTTGGITPVQ
jgi:hypothetical protein